MRSWFKAWGRTLGTLCAVVAFGASIAAADSSAAVKKDDSRLTVIQTQAEQDEPIYEVANKPKSKKQSSSFWNRMWHPSQWFSSSKSGKR